MLTIQVIYKSDTPNARGRNLRTIEVPVRRFAELPTNNMLCVTLRAKDTNDVWQPLRRITEMDHVALICVFRDDTTHWDLFGWDDNDFDPIDRMDPFADRSGSNRIPYAYPLKGAVTWFDGVKVSQDAWQETLLEITERQRKRSD